MRRAHNSLCAERHAHVVIREVPEGVVRWRASWQPLVDPHSVIDRCGEKGEVSRSMDMEKGDDEEVKDDENKDASVSGNDGSGRGSMDSPAPD